MSNPFRDLAFIVDEPPPETRADFQSYSNKAQPTLTPKSSFERLQQEDFQADHLCDQCRQIFSQSDEESAIIASLASRGQSNSKEIPKRPQIMQVTLMKPDTCQLCHTLTEGWSISTRSSVDAVVEYCLDIRLGFFMSVWDILFKLTDGDRTTKLARFGLHQVGTQEIGLPRTPKRETVLPPSTRLLGHSFSQIHKWLLECDLAHSSCNRFPRGESFIPSRLIAIRRTRKRNLVINLVETTDWNRPVKYTALSHCWGSFMPFKLTTKNYYKCLRDIQLTVVPPVFRDAIHVTVDVGVWYIWIDSLCIIQDSREDWEAEAVMMSSIYSHCFLNIAADGFADGSQGLFRERDARALRPIKLVVEQDFLMHSKDGFSELSKAGKYLLIDVHSWKNEVDEAPLGTRAWVVQERALSVRTLHFGRHQLFWECNCSNASEMFPYGFLRGTVVDSLKGFAHKDAKEQGTISAWSWSLLKETYGKKEKHRSPQASVTSSGDLKSDGQELGQIDTDLRYLDALPNFREICRLPVELLDELDYEGIHTHRKQLVTWRRMHLPDSLEAPLHRDMTLVQEAWCDAVEAYSACKLSFSSDKFIALSGMARIIGAKMSCQFLAGLWRKDLEHWLLWKVVQARPRILDPRGRGPSWSWASVDGTIKYDRWDGWFYSDSPGEIEWLAEIDTAEVCLASQDPFGPVASGHLQLTGLLGILNLKGDRDDTFGQDLVGLPQKIKGIEFHCDTTETSQQFDVGHEIVHRYINFSGDQFANDGADVRNVFYMPLRIMDYDKDKTDCETPFLQGLLLQPIEGRRGYYTRIGLFSVSDQFISNDNSGNVIPFRQRTDDIGLEYYVSEQENGQYTIVIV